MLKRVLVSACVVFSAVVFTRAVAQPLYKKSADGIAVSLPVKLSSEARLLRVQVVSDKIIHITATPEADFSPAKSLMVVEQNHKPVSWSVVAEGDDLLLSTAALRVHISKQGTLSFTDKAGKSILSEQPGRAFIPISNNGENSYHIIQNFNSPANEAIYGLGQHQNGIVNFKNQHLDLFQNNTEVAVPFWYPVKITASCGIIIP